MLSDALAADPGVTLAAALADARHHTLALYAHLDDDTRRFPQEPGINLPVWELGHIGWFQEYWCLRHRGSEASPLPSRIAAADAFWDSSKVAYGRRWSLPLPSWDGVLAYLASTLEATLAALDRSLPEDRYRFELALRHEDMHGEALLMSLQSLGLPSSLPGRPGRGDLLPSAPPAHGDVSFPGGDFQLGTSCALAARRFSFDNEKWAHPVQVAPFCIARCCVTNEEFAAFVEDAGYERQDLWSGSGKAWLARSQRSAPAYWRRDTAGHWLARAFDAAHLMPPRAPVQHVNAFEASAWCRWAGRRLPTEAEWEFAARHGLSVDDDDRPSATEMLNANLDAVREGTVDAGSGPRPSTGLAHLLGNVWEWTSSPFLPYPGFVPDAYADYSAPWFGDHVVLRGGSWATRSRLVHHRFRNFYRPDRHDPFAGFRTCALA